MHGKYHSGVLLSPKPPPFSFLPSAYSQLCSELSAPNFTGSDSFYVRVNLNIEPHDEPQSLGVSCDDIIHVTDTRYNGKYQWRCSVVDQQTAKPLQTGTMPNYNRFAQSICKNGRILHHTHANGDCSCLLALKCMCCIMFAQFIWTTWISSGHSSCCW